MELADGTAGLIPLLWQLGDGFFRGMLFCPCPHSVQREHEKSEMTERVHFLPV